MEKEEKSFLKRFFNQIEINKKENIISINKNMLEKNKKTLRLAKKISKKIVKEDIKEVVLSNYIKENDKILSSIKSKNIKIFDGRWLMKYILLDIVNYVLEKKNLSINSCTIALLVNGISDTVIQNIKIFAELFKNITIVTSNIEKVQRLEEMYNKDGIMLIVSNNKKKVLLKKDVIINFDFCEEELNKYNINNEAIIVNVERNIKIYKKRFCGLNINDYEIKLLNKEKIFSYYIDNEKIIQGHIEILKNVLINENKYNDKEIYESLIYRRDNFNNIRQEICKDKIAINNVIGMKGKLF